MKNANCPELSKELEDSFCSSDSTASRQFAKSTGIATLIKGDTASSLQSELNGHFIPQKIEVLTRSGMLATKMINQYLG